MSAWEMNGATKTLDDAEIGNVKFVKNDDAIDVNAKTKLVGGLTKDQLEKYRDDLFYRPLRYTLFVAFWLTWVALFVGAVVLVVLSPKNIKPIEDDGSKWFETAINYQIYTPSFYDSDGDGVGDLRGIAAKLDWLRRIGITAIRPTPILATIKDDFQPMYVLDVLAIDERFGSAEDARAVVAAAHAAGIRVIIDLPLTIDPTVPYAKAKAPSSAKETSKEHAALLDIANMTNIERLGEAARNILRWGVDAIQITDYGHVKKPSQTKSLDSLIAKIREIARTDEAIYEKDPVIIVEWAWRSAATLADVYVRPLITVPEVGGGSLLDQLVASIAVAAALPQIATTSDLSVMSSTVETLVKKRPYLPMWTYADLAMPRLDQQIDLDPVLAKHTTETMAALALVQLLLPGPISVYYGEEFGLGSVRPTAWRFPQRGIMRWDGAAVLHAGFTASTVAGEIFFGDLDGTAAANQHIAFEQQLADPDSQLRTFKRIAELHARSTVLKRGAFLHAVEGGVSIYARIAAIDQPSDGEAFVLAINWPTDGRVEPRPLRRVALQRMIGAGRSLAAGEIKAVAHGIASAAVETHAVGGRLADALTILTLTPFEAVLLRFP